MKHIAYVISICTLIIMSSATLAHAQSTDAQKAKLEAELKALEAEIAQHKSTITEKKTQSASLQRDITILTSKIAETKAKIKARDIAISSIKEDIYEKESTIQDLSEKIDRQKESLAQIIRKQNVLDSASFVEFALAKNSLSDYFSDEDTFSTVKYALNQSFEELGTAKDQVEEARESLIEKKDKEEALKALQEAERKKTEAAQRAKDQALKVTKGEEKQYTTLLKEREKEAAKIRTALFALRDSAGIQFGTAVEYAKQAGSATGVRPALILAILMQESSLGANVGTCYLSSANDGSGITIKTSAAKSNVMHPTRDVPVFLTMMAELGRDPYKTRISCPLSYGYGGAMGPSQFIPSTWKIFAKRIAGATGSSVADPWNAYHAITATGFYLADLGASSQNEFDERNAACKYYSGRACSRSSEAAGYGNSVMKRIADIQSRMDILQGN